ncbi:hypothetical protein V1L52_00460 [Treponema sp. HNW]|uniref:hypothetical protein n=1 Tax=Treponema sp. HNW TaxID=3116654 RepID=UPI003D126F30
MEMNSKKPQAKYEPGELQKTRQNLGQLEQEEAAFMIKRLGGEIGVEKPEVITDETLKKVRSVRKLPSSKKAGRVSRTKSPAASFDSDGISGGSIFSGAVQSGLPGKKYRLPVLTARQRQLFDKLMISSEYNIRPAPGFFAMLFSFGRGGPERVSESFIKNTLTAHIKHIDFFTEAVQALIAAVPASYRNKINAEEDFSFRALKIINTWDTLPVKTELAQLKKKTSWVMIEDTVPFIRELYRPLIKLYFLGEMQMTRLIKTLYGWTTEARADKNQNMRNLNNARQAAAEWLYIFGQVIKGLYPLLMRMCTPEYDVYPDFFSKRISDIMPFLEITKYDIILPKKDKGEKEDSEKKEEKTAEEKAAEEKEAEEKAKADAPARQNLILQSLGVLEKLFPEAGFTSLAENPDMYPYFQPLYSFPEGFNFLAPQNPLHVTIVLLRIVEDFFQGCRHIPMGRADVGNNPFEHDNLQKVFAGWTQYREVIFDKIMVPNLKECVNQAYTQNDFHTSRYGRREISNWLWQEKYYFHPHLTFEIAFIERPRIDTGYTPLPERIRGLVQLFSDMVRMADAAEVSMPLNLSAIYHFDVENSVSYRLNLLLGGGKSKERTNLNLMKYTLCALRVLDWWINDKDSLAYKTAASIPYRTAEGSSRPLLSVQLRSDQRDVFLRNLRIMHAVQKAEKQEESLSALHTANAAAIDAAGEPDPRLSAPLEGESAALEKD